MIIAGKFSNEIREIYSLSDKVYISPQSNSIAVSDKDIVNYVFFDDNTKEALGYISLYIKPDFIAKEEFNINIDNINPNSIYIWEIGTKKGFEGKKIASRLLEHIIEKYKDNDIYSCIEIENKASIHLHRKYGFTVVKVFEDNFFGRDKETYMIFKLTRN